MIVGILEPKKRKTGNLVCCICDNCKKEFISKLSEQTRRNKKLHFCNRECYKNYILGENNPTWKTGEDVYRSIYERHYGIKIKPGQEIHHINKNRKDNRWENLILLSISEHRKLHSIKI